MLIASNFLLWIVVALLVIAVLALARQIGVLHERIAPMGALVTGGGPMAGDLAPHVHATTIDGKPLATEMKALHEALVAEGTIP